MGNALRKFDGLQRIPAAIFHSRLVIVQYTANRSAISVSHNAGLTVGIANGSNTVATIKNPCLNIIVHRHSYFPQTRTDCSARRAYGIRQVQHTKIITAIKRTFANAQAHASGICCQKRIIIVPTPMAKIHRVDPQYVGSLAMAMKDLVQHIAIFVRTKLHCRGNAFRYRDDTAARLFQKFLCH